MIKPENLVRHEFIGLNVKVIDASNKYQKGIEGKVVDETRKIIKIEDEEKEKTIPKQDSVFLFTLPSNEKVKLEGNIIKVKPEERVGKKFKKW